MEVIIGFKIRDWSHYSSKNIKLILFIWSLASIVILTSGKNAPLYMELLFVF